MGASLSTPAPAFGEALSRLKDAPLDLNDTLTCNEIWDGLARSTTVDENIFQYFTAQDILQIRQKQPENLQALFEEVFFTLYGYDNNDMTLRRQPDIVVHRDETTNGCGACTFLACEGSLEFLDG